MDAISCQEVSIYQFFSGHPESWFSNREIAAQTKVNQRTVRAHTRLMFENGLLDKVHVFPGDRFRLSQPGAEKNEAYIRRLDDAAEVLGVKP